MVRRPLRSDRQYAVTLKVIAVDGNIGAWQRHWGGEAEGRLAWEALRDRLVARINPGHRPAPFWIYELGIPDELREIERPDPRQPRERRKKDPQIDRLEWLIGPGDAHLRVGERAEIDRSLEMLRGERRDLA